MISQISGTYDGHDGDCIVLDVNGVGYRVRVPDRLAIGGTQRFEIKLFVRAVYRETSADLYGFTSGAERGWFDRIIGIEGCGPAKAMLVLDRLDHMTLKIAVDSDKAAALVCKGLSKDGAQKIIDGLRK